MNINLTLALQMIAFAIFVWFCWRFIWPFIIEAMRTRQENIAKGLEAAEQSERRLAEASDEAEKQIAAARSESKDILERARQRGNQMIEEARVKAEEESERVKQSAQVEIEQDRNRVREDLRGKVADLTLLGAERVLGASVDRKAHDRLLDELVEEL